MKKQVRITWAPILANFFDLFPEIPESTEPFKPEPVAFTQAELQFLKDYLAKELTTVEEWKNYSKEAIDYYWERSSPDASDGNWYFVHLNKNKAELRKEKIKQKKLVAVQQKVKALLKTL